MTEKVDAHWVAKNLRELRILRRWLTECRDRPTRAEELATLKISPPHPTKEEERVAFKPHFELVEKMVLSQISRLESSTSNALALLMDEVSSNERD